MGRKRRMAADYGYRKDLRTRELTQLRLCRRWDPRPNPLSYAWIWLSLRPIQRSFSPMVFFSCCELATRISNHGGHGERRTGGRRP